MAGTSGLHTFYKLVPLKMGCEVRGLNLNHDPPQNVIEAIKSDVHRHRILIFKDQGVIPGDRQVDISKWFGTPDSTFYQHSCSPHHDVFRVSNDQSQGCTNVGRTGWHIDGSFQEKPFSHSIYHMVSVPKAGATIFAGLREVINDLSAEQRARWDRLSMESDRRSGPVHPLMYSHPFTKEQTLCFHLGMTESFVWDHGTDRARRTKPQETSEILKEIFNEFIKDDNKNQYRHEWSEGELIISDNLAVGHEASAETQLPVSQVGLRVLHRVTIAGTSSPRK